MRQTPRDSEGSSERRRRTSFRLAVAFLPVVLLLAVLEIGLRLGNCGYATQFLIEGVEGGRKVLIDNPHFAWRFMPPALARSPQPVQVPAEKASGGLRIVVLGESAAMGDPEPAFGFSRMLRVLLEDRYPGRRIEVINTAFPAINSHVIREIARGCRLVQADAWIIYMGNNEVLGPFGLTTAFGARAPSMPVVRGGLWLRQFRTGQIIGATAARLGPAPAKNSRAMQEALGKEPIEADDPRLARIYEYFEANLRAVIDAGHRAGARMLVHTMVSNLRDCGPFIASRPPSLPEAQLAEWERLLSEGRKAIAEGEFRHGLATLNAVAALDERQAELQFQLGKANLALSRTNEAKRHFEFARDLDSFRARADSRINEVIRRVASEYKSDRVRLLDAENAFAAASAGGITGGELLCDHVHFRPAGNYLLARLEADSIAAWLEGTNAASTWPGFDECAKRLALTDWSKHRLATSLRRQFSAPIFRGQSNHAERDARLRAELRALEAANRPEAMEQHTRVFDLAVAQSPEDWVLYDQLGKLRLAMGDRVGAANAWSNVLRIVPHAFMGQYQLGLLLAQPETAAAAMTHLRTALELRPHVPEVHAALGTAWTHLERPSEADAAFKRALALDPDNEQARIAWAQSLKARRQPEAARTQLEHVVAANTNSAMAHLHLAPQQACILLGCVTKNSKCL